MAVESLDNLRNSVPVPTPFNEDLSLDLESFISHLDFLYTNNIRSIIIGGTTGEGLTLSNSERRILVETSLNRYKDLTVWGGITTYSSQIENTLEAFQMTSHLLVNPPFFVKPTRDDIIDFYRKLLKVCNQKIVLYNNPARLLVDISGLYPELFSLDERIIGVKETSFKKIPEYKWWCGEDSKMIEYSDNYFGTISVVANFEPELMNDLINKKDFDKQKFKIAIDKISLASNPLIVKNILWKVGIIKTPKTRFPISLPASTFDLL